MANEMAEAAASGLDVFAEDGTQGALEGTDNIKVKFVGMSFDAIEGTDFKIGDQYDFHVTARCVGLSQEESKQDGHIRDIAKMDVRSVSME